MQLHSHENLVTFCGNPSHSLKTFNFVSMLNNFSRINARKLSNLKTSVKTISKVFHKFVFTFQIFFISILKVLAMNFESMSLYNALSSLLYPYFHNRENYTSKEDHFFSLGFLIFEYIFKSKI